MRLSWTRKGDKRKFVTNKLPTLQIHTHTNIHTYMQAYIQICLQHIQT